MKNIIIELAKEAHKEAKRSFCKKKQVGAVLYNTKKYNIVGRGSGGSVMPCRECVRKKHTWTQDGCWSIHAEVQALFDYFYNYRFQFCNPFLICIVTHGPCDQCLKYLEYFCVKKVYYDIDYHTDYSKWDNRIEVIKINK